MKFIRPFERLGKSDAGIAGGKGASLGEMTQAGIPVPPGFVITANAFETFLDTANLRVELEAVLGTVDKETMHTVENASEKIQALILKASMPEAIASEIFSNHEKLDAEFVAVRSSATAEDSSTAAWAGQLDTFLNTTDEKLIENVQRCWASLFTPRAIFYRFEKGMQKDKISVAVVVQKMVQSEVSGIAFSVHPVTEDYNQMIIEAGFGLGEAIVSGQVTPDSFVIEKVPRRIIDKNITYQNRALVRGPSPDSAEIQHSNILKNVGMSEQANVWRVLSETEGSKPTLSDAQVLHLAELILRIEKHYSFPCDIEWAFEAGQFFITQSRPITTLSKNYTPDLIEQITSTDWLQDWSGMYTYLVATLDNQPGKEAYFTFFENTFGKSISKMLIIFDHDHATAWQPEKEYEELSTYLAQKACEPDFLEKWLRDYNETSERLFTLVKLPVAEFIKRFDEFRAIYPMYAPLVIAAKNAYDFLPIGRDGVGQKLLTTREKTESFYSLSHGLFDCICAEIAKKVDYSPDAVRAMNIDEFAEYCRSGTVPKLETLSERLHIKGLLWQKGGMVHLTADDVQKIQDAWNREKPSGELRGTTAFPGKVTGRCKIIKDYRNAVIASDEVLVTVMTDPRFVPLMREACAIVTDAGGLLSHASIVARELKKPCIVGTKFATEVFKDGDMVEVDAEKGVVRKI